MQHSHWYDPQDRKQGSETPPSSEGAELSLRAEAGSAGGGALLTRGGEADEAGGTPEPATGGGGPRGGGPTLGGPPWWAPDWDAPLVRTRLYLEDDDNPFAAGRPSWAELGRLMSELRTRDLVLLGMLSQHRFLSSRQLSALFWPGRGHRGAQRRFNELHAGHRLAFRWVQEAPRRRGASARRPWVYLLTKRGAALVAQDRRLEAGTVIRRAQLAARSSAQAHHDLAVAEFFVGLAVAAAGWAGCGLYHWLGVDTMHRNHQLLGRDLVPDGWGRLLLPNREVLVNLEWDTGTEGNLQLSSKLRLYAGQLPLGEYVLFVAPHGAREQAIRRAMQYVLGPEVRDFPLLTTTARQLQRDGLLTAVWSPIGGESAQLSLLELPGGPRSELEVEHSLAKPYWWENRPGGGEGA